MKLSFTHISALLLIYTLLIACEDDVTPPFGTFEGELIAEFTETESGEAVGDTDIFVEYHYQGFEDTLSIGTHTTEADGTLRLEFIELMEATINWIRFSTTINDEERIAEKEILLELRTEEPFEVVEIEIEI